MKNSLYPILYMNLLITELICDYLGALCVYVIFKHYGDNLRYQPLYEKCKKEEMLQDDL